jgi:hypothetical protein
MSDMFDDPIFKKMHDARVRTGMTSISTGETDSRAVRLEGHPTFIAVGLKEGDDMVYVCHVDALDDPYPWIVMSRDEFREHWPHCQISLTLAKDDPLA